MGVYIDNEAALRRCAGRPTALFSGSFNPPHLGHLALLEAVLAQGLVAQVLVFPHSLNAGKQNDLVDIGHRVAMSRLLLESSSWAPSLHVCAPDFCHGYHEHMDYLADCLGGSDYIAILIGSDSLCRAAYPASIRRFRHLVHLRTNAGPMELPYDLPSDSVVLRGIHSLSSTEVRTRSPRERTSLLGEAVADYVRAHGLYR